MGDNLPAEFCGAKPCIMAEYIEGIRDSLISIDKRVTVLESNHGHVLQVIEGVEAHVMEAISNLALEFSTVKKAIWIGNGKPSFDQRITTLETAQASDIAVEVAIEAIKKQSWDRFKTFLPWISLVVGAAGSFAVQSLLKGH